MAESAPARWGGASGLAAVAAGVAATTFERGAPGPGAPVGQVSAFSATHADALLVQSLLMLLGVGFALCFLGGLFGVLARAGRGPGGTAGLAFGTGIAFFALSSVGQAVQIGQARLAVAAGASELVAPLAGLGWALFAVGAVPAAVMLAAFAAVTLRTGVFPRWLGWLAVAAAVSQGALLAGVVADSGPLAPGGWVGYLPYLLLLGWLGATSVLMVGRRPARRGLAPVLAHPARPHGRSG